MIDIILVSLTSAALGAVAGQSIFSNLYKNRMKVIEDDLKLVSELLEDNKNMIQFMQDNFTNLKNSFYSLAADTKKTTKKS